MYACLSGVLYDPRKRRRKPCHHRLSIRSARFVRSPSARPPGIRWYLRSETAQVSARSPAHVPQRPAGCFRDWTVPARSRCPGAAASRYLFPHRHCPCGAAAGSLRSHRHGVSDRPAGSSPKMVLHVCCLPFLRDRRVLSIPAKPYKAGRRVLCGIAYTIISQFCGNCKPAKGVAGQNGNMHKIHSRFPLKIEKKLRISA